MQASKQASNNNFRLTYGGKTLPNSDIKIGETSLFNVREPIVYISPPSGGGSSSSSSTPAETALAAAAATMTTAAPATTAMAYEGLVFNNILVHFTTNYQTLRIVNTPFDSTLRALHERIARHRGVFTGFLRVTHSGAWPKFAARDPAQRQRLSVFRVVVAGRCALACVDSTVTFSQTCTMFTLLDQRSRLVFT